jgi:hypothetical protein
LSSRPEVRTDTPTTVRLFGPEAIVAHTLVFTPAVGALLATINHRRLGNGERARRMALAFVLPGAVLLVAEFVAMGSPFGAMLRFLGFGWTVSVAYRLFFEHQVLFAKHVAAGGRAARWYLATLAVLGVIVVALTIVFAAELLVSPGAGSFRQE